MYIKEKELSKCITMLFEILLAAISISPISACGGPKISSILNCDTIKPGNTSVDFAQPMADGDEFIFRGKLFVKEALTRTRAIFDLEGSNGGIVLHFRYDFQSGGQREKIVLNSWTGSAWGNELHHASPFKPGQQVEIHVKKIGSIYEITVTDGVVLTFPHRLAASRNPISFSYLGDWTVSSIQMICAKQNSDSE
ncbi:unnamed protein product [Caenorhabditis bovis]|uniref:Galectin n=1 Tax=Caenorhabditis bovis TaxID=2654633 RepID=A0A8S1EUI7_9PELO|nr:unnamed protein product [Caenorhabditis bovis]